MELNAGKKQVAASLNPLVTQLRVALSALPAEPPAPPTDLSAASPAQSQAAAERLAKLLSEFDPGAADFIEANREALRPLFAVDAWPQFEKLVQGYSFAEAQAQLNETLKQFSPA